MTLYAIVHSGTVTAINSPPDGMTLAQAGVLSAADQAAAIAVGAGTLVTVGMAWPPAPPPAPTLAQQAAMALEAGLTITSTGAPSLSGRFSVSSASIGLIQGEMIAVAVNGTFADGTASVVWQEMDGTPHTFSLAQFKAFSLAVAKYVSDLSKVIGGLSTALPAPTAAIP